MKGGLTRHVHSFEKKEVDCANGAQCRARRKKGQAVPISKFHVQIAPLKRRLYAQNNNALSYQLRDKSRYFLPEKRQKSRAASKSATSEDGEKPRNEPWTIAPKSRGVCGSKKEVEPRRRASETRAVSRVCIRRLSSPPPPPRVKDPSRGRRTANDAREGSVKNV